MQVLSLDYVGWPSDRTPWKLPLKHMTALRDLHIALVLPMLGEHLAPIQPMLRQPLLQRAVVVVGKAALLAVRVMLRRPCRRLKESLWQRCSKAPTDLQCARSLCTDVLDNVLTHLRLLGRACLSGALPAGEGCLQLPDQAMRVVFDCSCLEPLPQSTLTRLGLE